MSFKLNLRSRASAWPSLLLAIYPIGMYVSREALLHMPRSLLHMPWSLLRIFKFFSQIKVKPTLWSSLFFSASTLWVCTSVPLAYAKVFFLDGYCSTVQGLLDWFEVDLGFAELLFIQIDSCVMYVFVLYVSPFGICPGLFCVSSSLFHKLRSSLRCEVPFFLACSFLVFVRPFWMYSSDCPGRHLAIRPEWKKSKWKK